MPGIKPFMTRRRWIADEHHGDAAFLTGEHAAHLTRVLRVQVGQQFDVVVAGAVRLGTVTAVAADRVELSLGDELPYAQQPALTLVLAIFKFDRMEWAIEKCTEIGVARITPVIVSRTDRYLALAAPKRFERWRRLVRQAAEQSRRSDVPEVDQPESLKTALTAAGPADAAESRIVLAESEKDLCLTDALASPVHKAMLAIGPEGGWTEEELRTFRQAGWSSVSLGPNILRAETAAIVASALLLDALR